MTTNTWKDRPILVLGGPNLGRLGTREPHIYGHGTHADLAGLVHEHARLRGCEVDVRQTDAEHEMLAWLYEAADGQNAVIINPAAWTHTSLAVGDAVAALPAPVVEVHLSNVFAREQVRHTSFVSPHALGVICGFGFAGYRAAVDLLLDRATEV